MGNKEFYRLAKAYDIAFSDRDYITECDFLEWIFNKHSVCEESKQKYFLELACGPANHAREFVKRGWSSIGLDLSNDMIEYAKLKDEDEKYYCEYVVDDFVNFTLPKKVHFITNLMESISHITTNENLLKHFQSVAEVMVKGGIYLIEGTHPRYFFPDEEANRWITKQDDFKVEIQFGDPSDEYNSITQLWNVTTGFKIWENGILKDKSESKSYHRFYLAQEMKLFIELSQQFDAYWFYGNSLIPPRELDDSDDSDSFVIVLRKK
ncbi:MAG: class I SAM-dependent methyltransferase [Ignavibacteria bacterium]|nr:class I SAM-dependent methyltransferase [Ignavibacteria bacterium]